ncbi:AIPR family protein [Limnoraphis robusta]|uniref:AIPR family protein n=1 Tax=Limnoraphis robusta TaxID=1118279 RepID=UPI002B212BD8|nr:AIPR family protein [Limnoraphis robusta]MEA5498728.1 AIPR family protein [Limnoraphis robusta BA-68 BA1]
MSLPSLDHFSNRTDLQKYGTDALPLFALQLRFQIEDIDTVATTSLTDKATKGDDKKCDLIYVDKDLGHIVVIQAYFANNPNKNVAPSNKAADLNTAAAWLFNSPINDLPEGLQSAVEEVRSALEENCINFVQFWYVHNLQESKNVKNELSMVAQTVNNFLKTKFPQTNVESIVALEVGQQTLDEWYKSLESPILVTDSFTIPIANGYTISGNEWDAFVTAVPLSWLHEVFKKYDTKLFSANIRGYLGSRKSDSNINNGIKETAQASPDNFWVYNNGITALVSHFEEVLDNEKPSNSESKCLQIQGISIVNGAQTTGAIGSLKHQPTSTGKVQARFVRCNNINTIRSIIEYNNRQNEIEASDFRSNDPIQRRLRQEFDQIPETSYSGGRRGGSEDIIRRPSNLLPSDTIAQSLAAFHQDPVLAYNKKSDIWKIDKTYAKYFNEQTTAEHIVFTYSLLRAIESKNRSLTDKQKENRLSELEEEQLNFFRKRGSHFLLESAIAKCLEIFLDCSIPSTFKVSFGKISPQKAEDIWHEIVDITIPFSSYLTSAVSKSLSNSDEATKAINAFRNIVESTKRYHSETTFRSFASHVKFSS